MMDGGEDDATSGVKYRCGVRDLRRSSEGGSLLGKLRISTGGDVDRESSCFKDACGVKKYKGDEVSMRETEDRWTTADVSSGEGREMKNEEEVMREELGVGGFTNMDGVGDTKPRSRESRGDWRVLADGNPVDVVVGEGLKGCCAVGRWVMVGVAK